MQQKRKYRGTGASALTERECDVLHAIADGRSYKEVAAHLGISYHTVNAHLKAILKKTGAGSTRRLTAMANRGLIPSFSDCAENATDENGT